MKPIILYVPQRLISELQIRIRLFYKIIILCNNKIVLQIIFYL